MTLPTTDRDLSHLGEAIARYTAPREDFYKSLLIIVFLLGGALAFILAVTALVALTDQLLGVVVISAVIVALLAVPMLRLLRFASRLWAVRTIYLYTHGVVVEEGDVTEVFHWDDLAALYIRVRRLGVDYMPDSEAAQASARLNFLLTLQRTDGTTFDIESAVRQMKEIANGIGKRLAVHKFEGLQQHITDNGSYHFGRLTVYDDRMSYDDLDYRWYPLQRVEFGYAEHMVVWQAGAPRPRAVLPVAAIPNVHLLMLLLEPHAEVYDMDGLPVERARWQKLMRA
jgi:hypothetical protein